MATKKATPAKSTKPATKKPTAKSAKTTKPAKAAAKPAPAKFSWKAVEKQLEKLKTLVDDDKHAEAMPLLEALVDSFPPRPPPDETGEPPMDHDDERGNAFNLLGITYKNQKMFAKARVALSEAAGLGDSYSELNLLDMMSDEETDWPGVIALVTKMRDQRYLDTYSRVWVARYISIAHLELGDVAKAEAEMRKVVADYSIEEAALVESAREGIEKYVEPGTRPNTDAARAFLAWLKPKSYDPTPAEAATNKAWWKALDKVIQKKLVEEAKLEIEPAKASDKDIARLFDVTDLDIDEDEKTFDDVTPFLSLVNLTRLGFYGKPETIEPLRALTKLTRLNINNNVTKNFRWYTPADRALWKAAAKCDRKGIEKALADGASLASRDEDGETAVQKVAQEHDTKLVLELIAKGADPWAGCHGESNTFYFSGDEDKQKFAAAAVAAGITHADEDPFRELSVNREPKCATFDKIDGVDFDIDDGESLAAKWPANAKMKMEPPKKDNKLYPMVRCGYRAAAVNEQIADIIRGVPHVELLPVTIIDHDGKIRAEKYFVLNPLELDCLDAERCFPQWNHLDDESASEIAAFAFDMTKAKDAQIFRPGLINGRPMIVSKALAEKLRGIPGVTIDYLKR